MAEEELHIMHATGKEASPDDLKVAPAQYDMEGENNAIVDLKTDRHADNEHIVETEEVLVADTVMASPLSSPSTQPTPNATSNVNKSTGSDLDRYHYL